MNEKTQSKSSELVHVSDVRVRFSECDPPLGIVWHGNYIQFFEDAREAFGRAHGISYLDQKAHNFSTPIVSSKCEHKLPLAYGDIAKVKTTFIDSAAAKMILGTRLPIRKARSCALVKPYRYLLNSAENYHLPYRNSFENGKLKSDY